MNSIIENINSPFTGKIVYYREIGSTMDAARALTGSGKPPSGTLVRAGVQTSGRGRIPGRRWNSRPGENLLFTILIKRKDSFVPLSAFPLAVGLAVAKTVEVYGLEPRLKWPNDLLCGGAKLCGILCETAGEYLSAGIGLNCNQERFPETTNRPPASLRTLTGEVFNLQEVLENFLVQFHLVLKDEQWLAGITARLFSQGEAVLLSEGAAAQGVPEAVVLRGVGGLGQLIVEDLHGKTREVYSGEIIYGQ